MDAVELLVTSNTNVTGDSWGQQKTAGPAEGALELKQAVHAENIPLPDYQ